MNKEASDYSANSNELICIIQSEISIVKYEYIRNSKFL